VRPATEMDAVAFVTFIFNSALLLNAILKSSGHG